MKEHADHWKKETFARKYSEAVTVADYRELQDHAEDWARVNGLSDQMTGLALSGLLKNAEIAEINEQISASFGEGRDWLVRRGAVNILFDAVRDADLEDAGQSKKEALARFVSAVSQWQREYPTDPILPTWNAGIEEQSLLIDLWSEFGDGLSTNRTIPTPKI